MPAITISTALATAGTILALGDDAVAFINSLKTLWSGQDVPLEKLQADIGLRKQSSARLNEVLAKHGATLDEEHARSLEGGFNLIEDVLAAKDTGGVEAAIVESALNGTSPTVRQILASRANRLTGIGIGTGVAGEVKNDFEVLERPKLG